MRVGIVIVSHSALLAEGVVELAGQMAQGKVVIVAAGGIMDGILGTSVEKITDALYKVEAGLDSAHPSEGIIVFLDMGSAVMATEMAIEAFTVNQRQVQVIISPAPLVEGAIVAAVEASIGNSLQEVAAAAAEAHALPKLHSHT